MPKVGVMELDATERLTKRKKVIILLFILAFAFVLRIWNIGGWRSVDWQHDEIGYLGCAAYKNYFRSNPLFCGELDLYLNLPAVVLVKEIGGALLIARMIRVLIGVMTILALYFFTKEFYDVKTALIAAFLIAVFPSHVFISRIALASPLTLLFCTLSLYSLCKFSLNRGERFVCLFASVAGLGILTHLSAVLFLVMISIPFFVFMKPRIGRKTLVVSFFIFAAISYPTIQFILGNPHVLFEYEENTNLPDVWGNLFQGIFSGFLSFLGGDVHGHYGDDSSVPSPLFSLFLLVFSLFCVKKKDGKSLFLASSLLIGIVLVSTVTISTFRPITFYVLTPVLSAMAARGIFLSYRKFGAIVLLGVILLSVTDIISITDEVSKSVHTFYPFCIKEVVKNIAMLKPSSVSIAEVSSVLRHPLEYRLYEVGLDQIYHRDEFYKNSLFVFFTSQTPYIAYTEGGEEFVNKVKSSGFNLHSVKNMTCDEDNEYGYLVRGEYNISYHFYTLYGESEL